MIRGLYASYSGMRAMLMRQDVIASNLANSNSVAYKQDFATVQAFPSREITRIVGKGDGGAPLELGLVGDSQGGSLLGIVRTDFSQGALKETGLSTDLALEGDGFFVVRNPAGERLYTRAGNFTVDASGRLIGPGGYPVLGDDGNDLQVGKRDFFVREDGRIMLGDEYVGRLMLVSFTDLDSLEKVGEGLFRAHGELAAPNALVRQGYLESSNVDAVEQMVSMIECFRAYESSQRLVQVQDRTLQRLIDQVGKV